MEVERVDINPLESWANQTKDQTGQARERKVEEAEKKEAVERS